MDFIRNYCSSSSSEDDDSLQEYVEKKEESFDEEVDETDMEEETVTEAETDAEEEEEEEMDEAVPAKLPANARRRITPIPLSKEVRETEGFPAHIDSLQAWEAEKEKHRQEIEEMKKKISFDDFLAVLGKVHVPRKLGSLFVPKVIRMGKGMLIHDSVSEDSSEEEKPVAKPPQDVSTAAPRPVVRRRKKPRGMLIEDSVSEGSGEEVEQAPPIVDSPPVSSPQVVPCQVASDQVVLRRSERLSKKRALDFAEPSDSEEDEAALPKSKRRPLRRVVRKTPRNKGWFQKKGQKKRRPDSDEVVEPSNSEEEEEVQRPKKRRPSPGPIVVLERSREAEDLLRQMEEAERLQKEMGPKSFGWFSPEKVLASIGITETEDLGRKTPLAIRRIGITEFPVVRRSAGCTYQLRSRRVV